MIRLHMLCAGVSFITAVAGASAVHAAVPECWSKARTLTAVVDNGDPCGSVQVKCGKVSRQGVASVSMTVTPFFGRKTSYRAQRVAVQDGNLVVAWPDGARIELNGAGSLIGGSLPDGRDLSVWSPGSRLGNGARFDLDAEGLASSFPGIFDAYLPTGLAVAVDARGRWTVAGGARAGKVAYRRGTQTVDTEKLGENPAGLKLAYSAKTGLFKGSFKIWQDVNGKIKSVSATVAGLVRDGEGFGAARVGKVVPLAVRLVPSGGVQLWEDGPYWAECNVGATKPEECGYYFWWGDTVGYKREGGTWTDNNYYSGVTWVSSTGTQMSSSPFTKSACRTFEVANDELLSAGYIDSTGNLVAAHDAATVHLGVPWRMPSDAEIGALISNCTTKWTTRNGVYGRLVRGRGAYASKSIFLPAAGYCRDVRLRYFGSAGYVGSSTLHSNNWGLTWFLYFSSGRFYKNDDERYFGRSVRPVRGFAK